MAGVRGAPSKAIVSPLGCTEGGHTVCEPVESSSTSISDFFVIGSGGVVYFVVTGGGLHR